MEEMQKYRKNKSNICDDLSRRSATPDSLMEVEGESSDEEGEITSQSSTVDDLPSVPPVLDSFSEADKLEADKAWVEYIAENNTVVVNSFQGEFKSTIICSECSRISVTFDPFMYLSLPWNDKSVL
ncbi:hypothetical protein SNE40_023649 [Patella caerulea]|uniref:ubiquitinyl hydrolase 1 n=1 Tax=Patella caerulea TaxID=87958 RepID=A0AAN8GEX6_PATCE